MQSEGQAAAHRKQATHFSRPSSSTCRRCWPRKRGWSVTGSSGYCTVHFSRGMYEAVVIIPLMMARVFSITSLMMPISPLALNEFQAAEEVGQLDLRVLFGVGAVDGVLADGV